MFTLKNYFHIHDTIINRIHVYDVIFFSQKLAWMQNWETYCSYEIFLNFKGHIDILTKQKTV